ncbi:MAG: histidine kinase [Actinomycetia bacterium]|nr:histidine kinase [Actinomycetes bacterium]
MSNVPAQRGNTLRLRLAFAFLGVALTALALLAVLAAVFSAADVSSLANQQRAELASAFAVAVGGSWAQHHGWARADLAPVVDLAARSGVRLQVRDMAGRAVVTTTGSGSAAEPGPGEQSSAPVLVQGRQVGTVYVGLTASGLGAADNVLRTALLRAVAGTAGLAALLALITGLVVARRITRPIARLIEVARAMASGDRSARAGEVSGPGELRELAAAFDQMADTLDYEDKIRRDLVASVAHELRTPVAVLQAGHEALLDGVTEPNPHELGSLRDEVLRLARMVDDLQTMAAAAAAVLHLTREPCDLAGIAAAAADSLARRFEAAEVALDRQLAAAPVVADERWMHQVVTNLLGNALKFTPAGGRVTLRTGLDGPNAVLTVEDTGVGIPADELPHVFDQFWRGQAAAQTSGSGIGLAIASQLALAHGGTLIAASQPGVGTRLTLTLPRA